MSELQHLLASNAAGVKRMETMSPLLCQWFSQELLGIHRAMPRTDGGLLMGCPVWGAEYLDRMVRYSLPTLGTDRNLEALSGKSAIVFYGMPGERPSLWEATRWMRQAGIHTVWRDIPAEVMRELVEKQDKYGILSCVGNLLAHEAGHNGMGMHFYCPDHAYAEGYFHALARLSAKAPAIIQQGPSAETTGMLPELEKRRDQATGAIAITARELGGLAFRHMHQRTSRTILNSAKFGEQWPRSHQVSWVGKDAFHMASSPQNIAYLSPQLCLDAPIAFTSTLDMLAPEYIPPGEWIMPGPDDGMVFCELSPPMTMTPSGWCDAEVFALRYWQQVAFTSDYQEYFRKRCLTPIDEQAEYMAEADIAEQHELTANALEACRHQMQDHFFASQCPTRWGRAA